MPTCSEGLILVLGIILTHESTMYKACFEGYRFNDKINVLLDSRKTLIIDQGLRNLIILKLNLARIIMQMDP